MPKWVLKQKIMKKSILLCSLVFLFAGATLYAQNDNNDDDNDVRTDFTFGVKAGINSSNVWDEEGQDFEADNRVGFAGGIFFGIPISKFIGLQPELLLSQKGFQGSGTLLGTTYSFTKTTSFIDIPILLQIKPVRFVTFLFGPQFSYLVNEKNTYTFGANSTAQEKEFDNDNIRKNILGFSAGADVNIQHVVVSGRAGWDFQTNHGDGSSSTPRYKNQWLQLTIGFKM